MNNTPKLAIGTVVKTGKKLPEPKRPQGRTSGKQTESLTMRAIKQYYGLDCRVDRLPDSLDVGRYEDIRPCDLFVTISSGVASDKNTIWYIECKETTRESVTLPFSVLKKGQIQAINNTHRMRVPYFVVFNHMKTNTVYLVPAKEILNKLDEGKKSLNSKELEAFIWLEKGKLYDYH